MTDHCRGTKALVSRQDGFWDAAHTAALHRGQASSTTVWFSSFLGSSCFSRPTQGFPESVVPPDSVTHKSLPQALLLGNQPKTVIKEKKEGVHSVWPQVGALLVLAKGVSSQGWGEWAMQWVPGKVEGEKLRFYRE